MLVVMIVSIFDTKSNDPESKFETRWSQYNLFGGLNM